VLGVCDGSGVETNKHKQRSSSTPATRAPQLVAHGGRVLLFRGARDHGGAAHAAAALVVAILA
jgi:hypothetical protein